MKNSLFKRAIAAAAAVPLALTQCFTVATTTVAVDTAAPVADASKGTTVTLNDGVGSSILYVTPDESDGVEYDRTDATLWTKTADWNYDLSGLLTNLGAGANANGTLDLTKVYEKAIEKSGQFSEVTKSLTERMSDVNYSVDADGNITITATLNDITSTFTEGASKTIGGALKDIADQYGIEDFNTPENFFEGIVIGGDIEIKINGAALKDGTTVSGELTFVDAATGNVYKGSKVIDWALEKFALLTDTAKSTCAEYEAEYPIDLDDAAKQIDDSVSFYVGKLNAAKDKLNKALTKSKDYSYATMDELIADMKQKVENKTGKTIEGNTAAEIVQNQAIAEIYDDILSQLNEKVAPDKFDITASEFGELADEFTDITLSINAGHATLTAQFPDKEQDAVKDYVVNECNVEFIDSWKKVEAYVDFSAIESGTSSVSVDVWREVKVGDVITTTTAATTSTTEDTTTTTVDSTATDDDTTTTVDTTTTGDKDTTTTVDTTTTDDKDTTTTVDTTTTGDKDTTTTVDTTTTDGGDTTATVDTTTTGSEESSTSTSSTTDTDGDGNTIKIDTVVSVNADTTNGFYLSIDEEFNKDQVTSLTYTINKSRITINPDGVIIDEEVLEAGEPIDITQDMFEFNSTPTSVYDVNNTSFLYNVELVASQTIVAADGTIVANEGDAIVSITGSEDKGENLTVPVYVGLKGDNNLDNVIDPSDASNTLIWYATISTLAEGDSASNHQFSKSKMIESPDDILDEFACFLCDVNNDLDPDNYKTSKPDREFSPAESSYILRAYAELSTNTDIETLDRAAWDKILGR